MEGPAWRSCFKKYNLLEALVNGFRLSRVLVTTDLGNEVHFMLHFESHID